VRCDEIGVNWVSHVKESSENKISQLGFIKGGLIIEIQFSWEVPAITAYLMCFSCSLYI